MAVTMPELFFRLMHIARAATIIADVLYGASWFHYLLYTTLGQIVLGVLVTKQLLTTNRPGTFLAVTASAFVFTHYAFPLVLAPAIWWRGYWLSYLPYFICWKKRAILQRYGACKEWTLARYRRFKTALRAKAREGRRKTHLFRKSWREGRLRELMITYRVPFVDKSISDGCPICADDTPSSAMYKFSRPGECQHSLCYDCLRRSIISADVKTPTCPMCKAEGAEGTVEITHLHIAEAFYCEPEQVGRLARLQVQRVLESMGDVIFCPTPDCQNACFALEKDRFEQPPPRPARQAHVRPQKKGGGWLSYFWGSEKAPAEPQRPPAPPLPLPKSFTCRDCRYSYCTKCKEPWTTGNTTHMGFQCRDYAQTRSGILNDPTIAARQGAGTEGAKGCPRCGVLIELKEGCEHITCQCGYEFCWKCMQKWTGYSHFDTVTFKCKLPEETKGSAPAPTAQGGANQCAVM